MQIVAIVRLASSIEAEATALAAQLGTVVYDERLKLSAGLPALVLATPDVERATAVRAALQARGHGALQCATADVVAAADMTSLRRFGLDDDALVATDLPSTRLPWTDVLALIRATHRTHLVTTEVITEKKFAPIRAIATGGMMLNKKTKREVVTRTADADPVLYVFRRSGAPPWILREQGTQFAALGTQLTPIALRNFTRAVELLRARAPDATFDDRLVARRTSPAELDLLAHVLAADLRQQPLPYR